MAYLDCSKAPPGTTGVECHKSCGNLDMPPCVCIYMHTYIHTYTHTQNLYIPEILLVHIQSVAHVSFTLFFFWLNADKYRLYFGLRMSWWAGVRWTRRLHQWNQLPMCAQWSTVPLWSNTNCGLQHLVCPHFKSLSVSHTDTHTHHCCCWTLSWNILCDGQNTCCDNSIVVSYV